MSLVFERGDVVQGKGVSYSGLKGLVLGILGDGRREKVEVRWENGEVAEVFATQIWKLPSGQDYGPEIEAMINAHGVEDDDGEEHISGNDNPDNDESFDTVPEQEEKDDDV